MTISLNGNVCTEVLPLTMPRTGAWHVGVTVDGEIPLTGAVTLDLVGVKFLGTVVRGQPFVGDTKLWIVGGGGGMSRKLDAKNYSSGPSVRTIVKEILGDKETLSLESDAGILNSVLPNYHRMEGIASHALTTVLGKLGAVWRILADGTVWIGKDTYPEVAVPHVLEDEDWFSGILNIAPEAPTLRPGVTFLGHKIEEVVHYASPDKLRTEARLNSVNSSLGKFLQLIQREIDYTKRYPARVSLVNGDGTIQVVPDDQRVRGNGLDRVRVRSGVPGTITPKKGARCLLGFDAGDGSRPYAEGWDDGEVETMVLADGTAPTAHIGSTCNVFFPPLMPIQGTLNGQAFVGMLTIPDAGVGIIQDGNPKVLT